MGKLTVAEAERLQSSGVLTKNTVEKMQTEGLVSSRRTSSQRWVKTADGSWVRPTLYYAGGKGAKYSKKMTELTAKVHALFEEYGTTRTNS
jgi:hypothetical protein|tara:strand:- start:10 stop:282 length:273 start_codon:yes stop_codon:yes gene_type:complete